MPSATISTGTKKFLIAIAILVIAKIILAYTLYNFKEMVPDEEENYQIAHNHLAGHGYSVGPMPDGSYYLKAFHGSGTVFIYEFLQRYHVSKTAFIWFYFVLAHLFYILSVFYFYRLAKLFLGEWYARAAVICYCLHPAIVYFIGGFFVYENIVLCWLIIVMYFLFKWFLAKSYEAKYYVPLTVIIIISCLLRGQMIPLYLFIFTVYYLLVLFKKTFSYKFIFFMLMLVAGFFISHYPVFKKNRAMFGESILSTQSGFELLQGHNPYAADGWITDWQDSSSIFWRYVHLQVPGIDTMNEWQESKARRKLAINWIMGHPAEELKLILTKLRQYFIPSIHSLYGIPVLNPFDLFFHLGFLVFLFSELAGYRKKHHSGTFILLLPVLATLLITLIFFESGRLRYLAEPFMMICTWFFLQKVFNKTYRQSLVEKPNLNTGK